MNMIFIFNRDDTSSEEFCAHFWKLQSMVSCPAVFGLWQHPGCTWDKELPMGGIHGVKKEEKTAALHLLQGQIPNDPIHQLKGSTPPNSAVSKRSNLQETL